MPDEVTLLLGEATAHEDLAMDHRPPPSVQVVAGDTVRVCMSYRVHDQKDAEELWTFRLSTKVNGQDESISERIHRDRKLLSDDIISSVGVELDFPDAGEYTLSYEMFAQIAHKEWGDEEAFKPVASETVTGEVTVTVLDG